MLKKILIISGVSLISIAIVMGLLYYAFTMLADDMCGNTQIGAYKSPDSKLEINYYERDCGATTPFVENIELDGQTILRAVTYGNSDHPFTVKWIDAQKVSVTTASSIVSMRIYKMQDAYEDIRIIFDDKIKNGFKVQ